MTTTKTHRAAYFFARAGGRDPSEALAIACNLEAALKQRRADRRQAAWHGQQIVRLYRDGRFDDAAPHREASRELWAKIDQEGALPDPTDASVHPDDMAKTLAEWQPAAKRGMLSLLAGACLVVGALVSTPQPSSQPSRAARREMEEAAALVARKKALWLRRREQYRAAEEGSAERARFKRLTLAAGHEHLAAVARQEHRTEDRYVHERIARKFRSGTYT